MNDTTKEALAKIKAGSSPAPTLTATDVSVPEQVTPKCGFFQHYLCSRISNILITPKGTKITFTNYELFTDDPDVVHYLDTEIEAGLKIISRGRIVSKEDTQPMAALKRKHIEEFLASQQGRDFTAANAAEIAGKSLNTGIMTSEAVVTGDPIPEVTAD